MRNLRLVGHEFRFAQLSFWRSPAMVFFTIMLPIVFLLIFATIFGNSRIETLGNVKTTTYYVPAIITLAVVSATFVSLAMNLTITRESGLLKRGRGTPLPSWVFIAGQVGNSIVISVLMVIGISIIGRVLYGVPFPTDRLPAVLVTLIIGAASFSCLGIALSSFIPSREAASAITNLIALPLYFLSGVFIPEDEIPSGVLDVAGLFPIRHFFESFFAAWSPETTGSGFDWGSLLVVGLWGLAGLAVAIRYFRWTPRT